MKIEYFQIDMSSKSLLSNLFQKNKFHAVLHFESNCGELIQTNSIIERNEVNFIVTLNLLQVN